MTPDDLRRLIQLLGMMGSAHDGECLNAARMAQRHVAGLGATWEEVLNRTDSKGTFSEDTVREAYSSGHQAGYAKGLEEGRSTRPSDQGWITWRGVAKDMLNGHNAKLTDWERDFCQGFLDRGYP